MTIALLLSNTIGWSARYDTVIKILPQMFKELWINFRSFKIYYRVGGDVSPPYNPFFNLFVGRGHDPADPVTFFNEAAKEGTRPSSTVLFQIFSTCVC